MCLRAHARRLSVGTSTLYSQPIGGYWNTTLKYVCISKFFMSHVLYCVVGCIRLSNLSSVMFAHCLFTYMRTQDKLAHT
jgi:hypothetical protein